MANFGRAGGRDRGRTGGREGGRADGGRDGGREQDLARARLMIRDVFLAMNVYFCLDVRCGLNVSLTAEVSLLRFASFIITEIWRSRGPGLQGSEAPRFQGSRVPDF